MTHQAHAAQQTMRPGRRVRQHRGGPEAEAPEDTILEWPVTDRTQTQGGEIAAAVIVRGTAAGFAQEIDAGAHQLSGDEPIAAGGGDTGPSQYDFLLAALGCCTSMTVAMYARRKGWPLEEVTVWLRHAKIHASDCAEC